MAKVVLNVEGMSCEHCVKAVNKAISALPGVTKTEVDLAAKIVTVEFQAGQSTPDDFKAAIEDQGYDVV